MTKKTVRIVLDVLLTAMLVFEMFIQYTGWFLHEVIGFAFFATVVVHLALSAKWMKSTAHAAKTGKLRGRTIALATMGCLLAVTMIVLGVSSVAISGILSEAGFVWALGSYDMWAIVHAVSAYALAALVVVHLGMHWAFLASAFKVPYNPERRRAIGVGVNAVAAVGAIALGVAAAREILPQTLASAAAAESTETTRESLRDASDIAYSAPAAPSASASSAAPSASASNAAANSNSSRSGGRGKRNSTNSQPAASTSSASEQPAQTYSAEPSYQQPSTSSSQGVTGTCTLCRKNCPLSAPQCNKPYAAGLI